jgi:hypothetical protein
VTASVAFLAVARDRWRDLEQTAAEAYLHGLQDVGWRQTIHASASQPPQRSVTGPDASG